MKTFIHTIASLPRKRWLAQALATALLTASAFAVAPPADASLYVSVGFAPPPLPLYEQPPIPGPGYIWTPGYWAYDDLHGYYWVPGTWVRAPYVGALWTPGYWGWNDNVYVFYPGYWSDTVGYYGGIDYGFGYYGMGYYGGYWDHGGFYYNTAVNRIGAMPIATVYSKPVVVTNVSRVSFNGPSGISRRPTSTELANSRGARHLGPLSAQLQQQTMASHTASLRASVNHGKPPILATPRAGVFATSGASIRESTKLTTNAGNLRQSVRLGANADERTSAGSARPNRSFTSANSATHVRMNARPDETRPQGTVMRPDRDLGNSVRMNRPSIESRPVVQQRESALPRFERSPGDLPYRPAPNRMQQVRRQSPVPMMRMPPEAHAWTNGDVRMRTPSPSRGDDRGAPPSGRQKARRHDGG